MSLVDYASSSEEEDEPAGREGGRSSHNLAVPQQNPPPEKPHPTNDVPSKLPDASMLLNSPSLPSNTSGVYDHSSKVAAAMAQNESRKRDLNESAGSYRHGKIPRGNLPHSKNVQKTAGGLLCPPQLSGSYLLDVYFVTVVFGYESFEPNFCYRSNVVTEDINKLFTRRNVSEPQSSRAPSES